MKNILLILVLISVQSFGQKIKYAERLNADFTIDSFYQKQFTDSLFAYSNDAFVSFTREYYTSRGLTMPQNFGKFTLCADNIYRYRISPGTVVIPINADAGTNLVLTDHPNSEQPLANSQRSAVRVQSLGYTEARLTAIVMALSASVNSPRIYFQYSTDGVNWTGDGTAGNISLSSTGAKETGWIALPAEAIGNVYVRAAMNGVNGTADPALGNVTIQLR